jgi:hypothetical protein
MLSTILSVLFVWFALLGVNASFAKDSVEARKDIKQMCIEYTSEQFATSTGAGNMTAVQLFLDAGMDINSGGGAATICRQSSSYTRSLKIE